MTTTRRLVFADQVAVAAAAAHELLRQADAAIQARHIAHLVLTGGSMGEALMSALTSGGLDAPANTPDWNAVHLWWGDERFLPYGDSERNDTQADDAGLGRLLERGLEPDRVHRLPAPDDPMSGDDLAHAASSYASELRRAGREALLPKFDVVMLGMGPDGHVASLFPDHPSTVDAAGATATVIPVEGSPKPPPRRLSMSLPTLCSARQVWLLVAGAGKGEAVRRAQSTRDPHICPAGAVSGVNGTVWWLDAAAADQSGQISRD